MNTFVTILFVCLTAVNTNVLPSAQNSKIPPSVQVDLSHKYDASQEYVTEVANVIKNQFSTQKPQHSSSNQQIVQHMLDKSQHITQDNSTKQHQTAQKSQTERDGQHHVTRHHHTERHHSADKQQNVKQISHKESHQKVVKDHHNHHKNQHKHHWNAKAGKQIKQHKSENIHDGQHSSHHKSHKHHLGDKKRQHKHNKRHITEHHQNTKQEEEEAFEHEVVKLLKGVHTGKLNETTMIALNGHTDILFKHLRKLMKKDHLNVIPLPNRAVEVKQGTRCDLTHGKLKKISAIYPVQNTIISYNSDEEKVTLGIPFKFTDLKLQYKYQLNNHIKTHGTVKGLIESATFKAVFSYFYKSNKLTLDHLEENYKGDLTLTFHGHKFHDWIVDPITKAFTHSYHSKTIHELKNHIEENIQDNINTLSQRILHKIQHV